MFSLRRSLSTSTQGLLNAAHNHGAGHTMNPIANHTTNPIADHTMNPIANHLNGDQSPVPGAGLQAYASPRDNALTYTMPDSRMLSNYRFDCHSSRNNTITTLSSLTYDANAFKPPRSKVIAWFSGGSLKFKKSQRAGYEAGYQCAIHIFKTLEKLKQEHGSKVTVDLYFNGFGQGREALKTALMATEGVAIRDTIKSISDRTPLKIGGTRSSKARRL